MRSHGNSHPNSRLKWMFLSRLPAPAQGRRHQAVLERATWLKHLRLIPKPAVCDPGSVALFSPLFFSTMNHNKIRGNIEICQMNSHLICTLRPHSIFQKGTCRRQMKKPEGSAGLDVFQDYRLTYNIFEDVADELTGVSSFHNHGTLPFLHQLGGSALQEPL